jgi:hypothetical protein
MHAKLIAVPLISGALLTGCAGTYTPSEIAGLQAPEPGASRARALMLQFGYSVPDMTEKGVCAQAEDPRDEGHPYGADERSAASGACRASRASSRRASRAATS